MAKLRARTVQVRRLASSERDAMWALYAAHYANVTRDAFERDLDEKDHAIVLFSGAAIVGFSTLKRYSCIVDSERVHVVFSGDTIVDARHRGGHALQNAFGRYVTATWLRHPASRVYWLLVSKGYRTYLLLTRNFPEHWPRHDLATPPRERAILHALAFERFGAAWRPDLGIVHHGDAQPRLADGVAPLTADLAGRHADVAFFARANPGHAQGDELACLGRIDPRVWTFYVLRKRLAVAFRKTTSPHGRAAGAASAEGLAADGSARSP